MTDNVTFLKKLERAMAFDELAVRELAPYFAGSAIRSGKYDFSDTESTIRFGYINGRETESARRAPLDKLLLELVGAVKRWKDTKAIYGFDCTVTSLDVTDREQTLRDALTKLEAHLEGEA